MNITDLKIGDEVEYYAPKEWILDKTILIGKVTNYIVTGQNNHYVEINNSFLIPLNKTIRKIIPKNKEFLCPQCSKKHGWETNNVITSNYCSNCIESWAKSPPKKQNRVFRFEIIVTRGESKNTMIRDNLGGGYYAHHPNDGFINTIGGYTVKGNTQVDFNGLLAPDWMELGKSYTVEIKENESRD